MACIKSVSVNVFVQNPVYLVRARVNVHIRLHIHVWRDKDNEELLLGVRIRIYFPKKYGSRRSPEKSRIIHQRKAY